MEDDDAMGDERKKKEKMRGIYNEKINAGDMGIRNRNLYDMICRQCRTEPGRPRAKFSGCSASTSPASPVRREERLRNQNQTTSDGLRAFANSHRRESKFSSGLMTPEEAKNASQKQVRTERELIAEKG